MSGVTIAWDEAVPPITEAAGLGYARIQSDKTSTRMGLDAEHQWPTAGGLAGYHRYGSARPFFGTQSRVSSDGTDARLMLTSDTSQLFAMTSAGTVLVGGHRVISAFTAASTLPQRHQWVEEFGTITGVSSSQRVAYESAFSGIPYVFVQAEESGDAMSTVSRGIFFTVGSRTTDFLVQAWATSAVTGGTIQQPVSWLAVWRSLGTRAI